MSMSERLSGGDLWEKPTKPDEDYRLLAKNPGMTRADYVDFPGRAVKEEPEAVDGAAQGWITDQSEQHFSVLKAREERRRTHNTTQGRLRALCTAAERQDIDLPELVEICRLVESGEQRLLKQAA